MQQTRVAQGLPYYHKFIENFPTIEHLANAPEEKILRCWQGLGYYSRAKNLHKCARQVVREYGGKFPETYDNIIKLPGIGRYTAAAIASFAYNEPVAVVDGNVFRVLSRIYGINANIGSTKGTKQFYELANELIDHIRPDSFNQAIMEFGALQCIPKNPDCENCSFAESCYARQHNLQTAFPVKKKKIKVRDRYFNYLVITDNDRLAMKMRADKDIWSGLYDYVLIETSDKVKV